MTKIKNLSFIAFSAFFAMTLMPSGCFAEQSIFDADVESDFVVGLDSKVSGLNFYGAFLANYRQLEAAGISVGSRPYVSHVTRLHAYDFDGVWERKWHLLDEYHLIGLRFGAGISRVVSASPANVDMVPHAHSSFSIDLPMADLLWTRFGVRLDYEFGTTSYSSLSGFVGAVVGGPWLGIGD